MRLLRPPLFSHQGVPATVLIVQRELTYLTAASKIGHIARDRQHSITGMEAAGRKSAEEGFCEIISLEIQRQQWTLAGKRGSDRRLTKVADTHPRGLT